MKAYSSVLIVCLVCVGVISQSESADYHATVSSDAPEVRWSFDSKSPTTPIVKGDGPLKSVIRGSVGVDVPGPRGFAGDGTDITGYLGFDDKNTAIDVSGSGRYIAVTDPGKQSLLDFGIGESITLEAWINIGTLADGKHQYIVGKGRTGRGAANNQNYALRVTGVGGQACVGFLFRSADDNGNQVNWHRWISKVGFTPDPKRPWRHVAVTYTFGDGASIRGYIDGRPVHGAWDMGGKTNLGPVVDNDELWIGASMGGGSALMGYIDEVAIYRKALDADRIAARFELRGEITPKQLAIAKVKPVASAPPKKPVVAVPLPKVELSQGQIHVDVFEGIPNDDSWDFARDKVSDTYALPSMAFTESLEKYNEQGVREDRSRPHVIRTATKVKLPKGTHRLVLRSRHGSLLSVDGKVIASTPMHKTSNAHGPVHEIKRTLGDNIVPPAWGTKEVVVDIESTGDVEQIIMMEVHVGGKNRRAEIGESYVGVALDGEDMFRLVGSDTELTDAGWQTFVQSERETVLQSNRERRYAKSMAYAEYWRSRHDQARQFIAGLDPIEIPDVQSKFALNDIDRFINARLAADGVEPTGLIDDYAFIRRASLVTIGRIPTQAEIRAFMDAPKDQRRETLVDQLLSSPEWADHWVGYWQDVLAENPNLINPTLNNTGPFRWWIYEAMLDGLPMDRFATDLIMMNGSKNDGGTAGFAMASQNDAPMAAKAHIIGQAFLGIEMKCARCHDAPFHDSTQEDLFSMAAMLKRGAQKVPATSTIQASERAIKSMIVEVNLKPGQAVSPKWTFSEIAKEDVGRYVRDAKDSRALLASRITQPENRRFPQVMANRLWHRMMGFGLVHPVDDWEASEPSHPKLLDWLGREFAANGYDLKYLARKILLSHTFQRSVDGDRSKPTGESVHLFAAYPRRRMSAEQLLDSLFVAAGKSFNSEPLTIDTDGSRANGQALDFGNARRAWMFVSLSNERDRPSLTLPSARTLIDVLEQFGWRKSRQAPLTHRDDTPTVQQAAIMNNGVVASRIATLSDDNALTELCLSERDADALVTAIFERIYGRPPLPHQHKLMVDLLQPGFDQRIVPEAKPVVRERQLYAIGWSNHLNPKANAIKVEWEEKVRAGDPPTKRLVEDWRVRVEDMLWAMINSPEFMFLP